MTPQQEAILTQIVRHAWSGHGRNGDNALAAMGITTEEELLRRTRAAVESPQTLGTRNGDGTYNFREVLPNGQQGIMVRWDPTWVRNLKKPEAADNAGSVYTNNNQAAQRAQMDLHNKAKNELEYMGQEGKRSLGEYIFANKGMKKGDPSILTDIARSHKFGVPIPGGNLATLGALDGRHGATLRAAIDQHGLIGPDQAHMARRNIPARFVGRAAGIVGVVLGAAAAAEEAAASQGRRPNVGDYIAGAWSNTAGGALSEGRKMEALMRLVDGVDLSNGLGSTAARRALRQAGADVDPGVLDQFEKLSPEGVRQFRRNSNLLAINARDQYAILQEAGLSDVSDSSGRRADVGAMLRDPVQRHAFMESLKTAQAAATNPEDKEKITRMITGAERYTELQQYRDQIVADSTRILQNPGNTKPGPALPTSPMAPISNASAIAELRTKIFSASGQEFDLRQITELFGVGAKDKSLSPLIKSDANPAWLNSENPIVVPIDLRNNFNDTNKPIERAPEKADPELRAQEQRKVPVPGSPVIPS